MPHFESEEAHEDFWLAQGVVTEDGESVYGPIPTAPVDGTDTRPQCLFCRREAKGPPAPFCCSDRREFTERNGR